MCCSVKKWKMISVFQFLCEEENKEKEEVEGIFKIVKASYACPLGYFDPKSGAFNCIHDCNPPLFLYPFLPLSCHFDIPIAI